MLHHQRFSTKPCFDGYQSEYPVHPSREIRHSRIRHPRPFYHEPQTHNIHLSHSTKGYPSLRGPPTARGEFPPRRRPFPRGQAIPRGRPFPRRQPMPRDPDTHSGYHHPRRGEIGPRYPPPVYRDRLDELDYTNSDYYKDYADYYDYSWTEESFSDPYSTEEGDDFNAYYDNFDVKETEGLTLVSSQRMEPTADPYGAWVPSSSEPVVKNKELDDWVPASEKTRVEVNPEKSEKVTPKDYSEWQKSQGVIKKASKRKLPKGTFTAAGKHPIGALKEKIPTCLFGEEARERYDELKFWKLTAWVKFTGYKFLGYGVTMTIAKSEAAIKALTFLDVEGLSELNDHIPESYSGKQRLLESVMEEEREETQIEEPWYISVGETGEETAVPIYKPKEHPTPETHPAMFLNQWYGPDIQTEYEIENPGFRPVMFSCTITVQGQAFQGSGPSKKEAQKMTAALTLQKLEENPPPINRKNIKKKKNKPNKSKKPKVITSIGDLPSLPKEHSLPIINFVPESKSQAAPAKILQRDTKLTPDAPSTANSSYQQDSTVEKPSSVVSTPNHQSIPKIGSKSVIANPQSTSQSKNSTSSSADWSDYNQYQSTQYAYNQSSYSYSDYQSSISQNSWYNGYNAQPYADYSQYHQSVSFTPPLPVYSQSQPP